MKKVLWVNYDSIYLRSNLNSFKPTNKLSRIRTFKMKKYIFLTHIFWSQIRTKLNWLRGLNLFSKPYEQHVWILPMAQFMFQQPM